MARPQVLPVRDADLADFTRFLHEHLGAGRRSPEEWRATFEQPWCDDKPNNGFMLVNGDAGIVGAIGAIYADRLVQGKMERFCNITSWCVLPKYRTQSMRLALALTSQPGLHFTDFTPTKAVTDVLRFLKFKDLDARQILVPNLPWAGALWTRTRVVDAPGEMLASLSEQRAKVLADHLPLPWLEHVVIRDSREPLHVTYKPMTFKGTPCAFVLAVSDGSVFREHLSLLLHYLLVKKRMALTRFERRIMGGAPLFSIGLKRFPRRLFFSRTLHESNIDNLYSELAAVDLRGELL